MRALAVVAMCWAGMGLALALAQSSERSTTFRHDLFVVEVPRGWWPARWVAGDGKQRFVPEHEPSQAISEDGAAHFADGNGNYFSVYFDSGTEPEADAVWTVGAGRSGSSVVVRGEGAMCKVVPGVEGPCSAGNGSLEIVTMPPVELRGHTYSFEFGNARHETGVPLEPFRRILRSFRAR